MSEEIMSRYVTDFGAFAMKGFRPWPGQRHPFGAHQRAAIKAIAQRWWEEGGNVDDLVL